MDIATFCKTGTAVFSIVNRKLTNYKALKALEALASGEKDLNSICNDHSEIFRFSLLIDALEKSSTYRKANLLKDLYLALDADEKNEKTDDLFYEIFAILGELSDREVHLLYLLDRYYSEDIIHKSSDTQYSKYFELITYGLDGGTDSDSFYYFAAELLQVNVEFLPALMKRLLRSGLITESDFDMQAKFQQYKHTVFYTEIKSRLILAMENSYRGSDRLTSVDI